MRTFYTDGFTIKGNPSKIGGGFTIFVDNKFLLRHRIPRYNFTNNESELLGVLYCSVISSNNDKIYTDSQLVLKWIFKGRTNVRPDLNWAIELIKEMISHKSIKIYWIPRDKNIAGSYNEKNYEDETNYIKPQKNIKPCF